jgi:hypothetical protein
MKKYLGYLFVFVAIAPVAIFLGVHEMAFFAFTFGTDSGQGFMSPLGYMLTGGGVFVWIGIFLWNAKSQLQKTVSLVMVFICVIGSLSTAIFNMYRETMIGAGFTLTMQEIKTMTLIIGILAIAHMLALILELAGQHIIAAWSDDDGDGVPNWLDKDNKPKPAQPQPVRKFAEDEELARLRAENAELKKLNPTQAGKQKE